MHHQTPESHVNVFLNPEPEVSKNTPYPFKIYTPNPLSKIITIPRRKHTKTILIPKRSPVKIFLTRRYGGLWPPTYSSCGGLRGPFGPLTCGGNLF